MRTMRMDIHRGELLHIGKSAEHLLEQLGRTGPGLVGDKVQLAISTDLATVEWCEISSILSSRTKQGRVNIQINDVETQVDVAKAKTILAMLQEAIEAAISDELIYKFMREDVGLDDEQASRAMVRFRLLRQGEAGAVRPH